MVSGGSKTRDWTPVESEVIKSTVQHGYGRGRSQLGIPTANVNVADIDVKVIDGIYFGWTFVGGLGRYPSVISVGSNPTYGNVTRTVEAHLLHDFEKDFYGAVIEIELLIQIRGVEKFDSFDELRKAIVEDIRWSKERRNRLPPSKLTEEITL